MKIRKTIKLEWDWRRENWIDPNSVAWGYDESEVSAKVYNTLMPPTGLVSLEQPYSVELVIGSRLDQTRTLTVRIRY